MMKALNDLCIKILLRNRMSLVSMLHYKDRSVPLSCQIASLQDSLFFLIFRYFSLFFLIFHFHSIVTKFVVVFSCCFFSHYFPTFRHYYFIIDNKLFLFVMGESRSEKCKWQQKHSRLNSK